MKTSDLEKHPPSLLIIALSGNLEWGSGWSSHAVLDQRAPCKASEMVIGDSETRHSRRAGQGQ